MDITLHLEYTQLYLVHVQVNDMIIGKPSSRYNHGHDFTFAESDDYGVCACGARENTDESVQDCPLLHIYDDTKEGTLCGNNLWNGSRLFAKVKT